LCIAEAHNIEAEAALRDKRTAINDSMTCGVPRSPQLLEDEGKSRPVAHLGKIRDVF
jgi:hypothetical protein